MSGAGTDHIEPGDPRVEEVADGVFAYIQPDGSWWINNTGFLVGRERVFAIDACSTERRTRRFRAAIESVTKAPVRTLLNTHHHGDHTHGNGYFPEATILAHEETRRLTLGQQPPPNGLAWESVDWGELPPAPPFVTYRDGVEVWVDERQVQVRHIGTPAHTTNDSTAWLPEERVLFSGDLVFAGGTPFLLMGSIAGALEAIEKMRGLEPVTIVPGHGNVCGPEVFDRIEAYLRFVQRSARDARTAGLAPLEAARNLDLGDFAGWTDSERIVGNLHRAYLELDGGARGAPLELVNALGDMVAYNGGRPLRCLA